MTNSIALNLPKFINLETFNQVWGYESQEIDDHANFKNPDSLLNKFNDSYHNVGRTFGNLSETGKATFLQDNENLKMILGTLGVVTGTSGLILSALMAAVTFDGMDAYQVIKNADTTEKLLQYSEEDVALINWDICNKLINNIETWIFPKLSVRIKSLTEIISMSPEVNIANDRLVLYLKALDELKVALDTLKSWVAFYESEWNSDQEAYLLYEKSIKDEYELEKKKLKLISDSLLIDKSEFVSRQRDIEDKYQVFKCKSGFGLVNECDHVRIDGSSYCFYHKCRKSDCDEESKKDMHFCEDHIKHVCDLKNEAENSSSKKGLNLSTKIFLSVLIPVVILFGAILLSNGASSLTEAPDIEAPAPAPIVESPAAEVDQPGDNQENTNSMPIMERLALARADRASFADWTDDDLVKDVEILANPQTQADLDAIKKEEDDYMEIECSGNGCILQKSIIDAAKLLREKKVKNAYEALGIKPNSQSESPENMTAY